MLTKAVAIAEVSTTGESVLSTSRWGPFVNYAALSDTTMSPLGRYTLTITYAPIDGSPQGLYFWHGNA